RGDRVSMHPNREPAIVGARACGVVPGAVVPALAWLAARAAPVAPSLVRRALQFEHRFARFALASRLSAAGAALALHARDVRCHAGGARAHARGQALFLPPAALPRGHARRGDADDVADPGARGAADRGARPPAGGPRAG